MGLVSDVISRIRRAADMVNNTFISDTNDLIPWINASQRELYDIVTGAYGNSYFMMSGQQTLSATEFLTLEGIYKIIRIDTPFDGRRVPMRRFDPSEVVINDAGEQWGSGTDIRYHVTGRPTDASDDDSTQIWFHPKPTGDHILNIFFVPGLGDIQTFSVEIIQAGLEQWDEFIVVDCAIKALRKARRDTQDFLIAKAELKQRIIDMAPNRDIGQPGVVADVQSVHNALGGDWWE